MSKGDNRKSNKETKKPKKEKVKTPATAGMAPKAGVEIGGKKAK